jgi:hypothetical protein
MDDHALSFEPHRHAVMPAWLFHVIVLAGLIMPLLAVLAMIHLLQWS